VSSLISTWHRWSRRTVLHSWVGETWRLKWSNPHHVSCSFSFL
jgi:hypothetical protein